MEQWGGQTEGMTKDYWPYMKTVTCQPPKREAKTSWLPPVAELHHYPDHCTDMCKNKIKLKFKFKFKIKTWS